MLMLSVPQTQTKAPLTGEILHFECPSIYILICWFVVVVVGCLLMCGLGWVLFLCF